MIEILQDDSESIYIEVQFEGKPRKEDAGIGAYEYWGAKGYDSQPYLGYQFNYL